MTAFDFTIAAVLGVSMLIGIYRGFVRESLSLVMLAVALVVAVKFSALPEVWLPNFEFLGYTLAGGDLQLALMFSLLFIAVLVAGRFINNTVSGAIRRSFMSLIDRLFGALFGLVRGGVLILALVLVSGLTSLPFAEWWRASVLIPPFEQLARYAMCYVPDTYQSPHYGCVSSVPGGQLQ